ncbi:MAG: esterase, partial [Armatimonadetes bacterium]|nr:esterase [Armatimonadota bacterium]
MRAAGRWLWVLGLALLLLCAAAPRGLAATHLVVARGPFDWYDRASGGAIRIMLRVTSTDPVAGAPRRYRWAYEVTNFNYSPAGGNAMGGFMVFATSNLTDRTFVTGQPAGWLNNVANAADPAIQFDGDARVLEWERPGAGALAPGGQLTFAFETAPREVVRSDGAAHTWGTGAPEFLITGELDVPGSLLASERVPLIYLPGFGASELVYDDGSGTSPLPNAFPNHLLKRFFRLLNGGSLRTPDPRILQFTQDGEPRVVASSLSVRSGGILRIPKPGQDAQRDLLDKLHADGWNVRALSYDFRHSVRRNAALLEQYLDTNYPGQRVDIVAHSMGGLVAKQYLHSRPYDHRVRNLIMVGTPHLGAPKALAVLRYGDKLAIDVMDTELIAKADPCFVRRAMHNWPGAYNLLPSRMYFATGTGEGYLEELRGADLNGDGASSRIDDFDETIQILKTSLERNRSCKLNAGPPPRDDPPPYETLAPALLDAECVDFHDTLDVWERPPDCRVYMIAGKNKSTLQRLQESKSGGPKMVRDLQGDGTVPLRSALAVGTHGTYLADLAKLKDDHLSMLADPQVIGQIEGLLLTGPGLYGADITVAP